MCIRDAEEGHDLFLYSLSPPFPFSFSIRQMCMMYFLWITGYDREFGITPTPQLGDVGWRSSVPLWEWYEDMFKKINLGFIS